MKMKWNLCCLPTIYRPFNNALFIALLHCCIVTIICFMNVYKTNAYFITPYIRRRNEISNI